MYLIGFTYSYLCRPKCLKHIFKAFVLNYISNHFHNARMWNNLGCFDRHFDVPLPVNPLFLSSVYFLVSVHYWLHGGRDAIPLVHWPQICPLHHVPHHNPAPVHSKRNWHPEVHKVNLVFQNNIQIWCDLIWFSSSGQCVGDPGSVLSVCGCDC